MLVLITRLRIIATVTVAALALAGAAAAIAAQRTFVSGNGSDADPCSLAAPCRTFTAALAQTDAKGEIVVLDSAGYGAVLVSQSVSIIAPPGVYASISVFATSPNAAGITVGGSGRVVLRGLSINGQGGDYGIWVLNNPTVHIENCVVSNVNSYGVRISGLIGKPEVFIDRSTISDNGASGVYASGAATVHIDRTRIERNEYGVYALNGADVTVSASVLSGNSAFGAIGYTNNGISSTYLTVAESTVSGNGSIGIYAYTEGDSGSAVRLRVARNVVSRNTGGIRVGFSVPSNIIATVSDNVVTDNGSFGILACCGATLTAAANAVSGGTLGLSQGFGALFRTRNNNLVHDNTTDVNGTTTFLAGE